ncbi:ABC transporter ATP-binding protein [Kurthia sibirica]|uniref:ABC transporter ATP-binding protein n=1 Tax=Kurthia sibirica TaxID=202750 RepID=UPI00117106DD|nr:ATP-binding cassette domain-containing protein [Kurthia sibirica]GEK33507.1 ABC transporter ATP-binding protein [Kurthia sibirica]
MNPLLIVRNLHIIHVSDEKSTEIIQGINFTIAPGEILGISGNAQSGKAILSKALMRLLPASHYLLSQGTIHLSNIELLSLQEQEMAKIRGHYLTMIFANPQRSFNPTKKIGQQLIDVLDRHQHLTATQAYEKALALLQFVELNDVEDLFTRYSYTLSAELAHKVSIAIALACQPKLIIIEEPSELVDALAQKELMKLLKKIQLHYKIAILLITQNPRFLADVCDQVIVLQHGKISDKPYAVTSSIDLKTRPKLLAEPTTLLDVRAITQYVTGENGEIFKAVNQCSFIVNTGDVFGIIGEANAGKSTLAYSILQLIHTTSGNILFKEIVLNALPKNKLQRVRCDIQILFQDFSSALNPRMQIGESLGRVLLLHNLVTTKQQKIKRVAELLQLVGLSPTHAQHYPHEFSAVQLQRINIARVLSVNPSLVILDEPFADFNPSEKKEIADLLQKLKYTFNLTYLFISRNITNALAICDRIAIMHKGTIVELATSAELASNPLHPYTCSILKSSFATDNIRNLTSQGYDDLKLKEITPTHFVLLP